MQACAGECLCAARAAFANRETVEGNFDQVFSFRARNQDVGSDFELEAPEFLFAGEVLRRFAIRAARDECEEALGVRAGDLLFGMGVEPSAVAAKDVEERKLCGEAE